MYGTPNTLSRYQSVLFARKKLIAIPRLLCPQSLLRLSVFQFLPTSRNCLVITSYDCTICSSFMDFFSGELRCFLFFFSLYFLRACSYYGCMLLFHLHVGWHIWDGPTTTFLLFSTCKSGWWETCLKGSVARFCWYTPHWLLYRYKKRNIERIDFYQRHVQRL